MNVVYFRGINDYVRVTMVGCNNIILSRFALQTLIRSEYRSGFCIQYRITDSGSNLGICLEDKIPDKHILYSDVVDSKFHIVHEFIKGVEGSTTINPTDEIYSVILDAQRFLTHKLECILNVVTKERILEYIQGGDDLTVLMGDIFNSSLTKSANK